jgi:hypothetical protein
MMRYRPDVKGSYIYQIIFFQSALSQSINRGKRHGTRIARMTRMHTDTVYRKEMFGKEPSNLRVSAQSAASAFPFRFDELPLQQHKQPRPKLSRFPAVTSASPFMKSPLNKSINVRASGAGLSPNLPQ